MEWVAADATYDLNGDRIVLSGFSAGGHVAGFAAISAATADTSTYTGTQNANNNRPAGYGYTATQSPWQFDFDENGQLTPPVPIGLLLWDAPVSVYQASIMGGAQGTANSNARKALYGAASGGTVAQTSDEADLDAYLAGGTRYSSAKDDADIPPVAMVYSSTADAVSNASSITALSTALGAIGKDVSSGVGVINSAGGLSRASVAYAHANLMRLRGPAFEFEVAWLRSLPAEVDLPLLVGSAQVEGAFIGSGEVEALYFGSAQIWP